MSPMMVEFESQENGGVDEPTPQPQAQDKLDKHGHGSPGSTGGTLPTPSSSSPATPPTTPSDPRAELAELMKAGAPYWKGDKQALARVTKLHQILAGEAPEPEPDEQKLEQKPEKEQATEEIPLLDSPPPDWSTDDENVFRTLAQDLGTPPALTEEVVQAVLEGGKDLTYETPEACQAALEEKHGLDAPALLEHARLAVEVAGQEVRDYLNRTGLGNSLAVLEIAGKLGQQIVHAREAITELQNDERYYSPAHPEHRLAVIEMARLQKLADPFERPR